METLQKILHPVSLLQGERVVVVTGADKGIGYATVKQMLRENPNWIVYLTARDVNLGQAAVSRLHQDISLSARFHQLDINDINSIRRFRDHIRENHKSGIHILVNNAGIWPDSESHEVSSGKSSEVSGVSGTAPEVQQAGKEIGAGERKDVGEGIEKEGEQKHKKEVKFHFDNDNFKSVFKTNYFGTLNVCQELFPLMGDNSSVIFVGSRLANLVFTCLKEDKQLLLRGCTRIDDCTHLMERIMNSDPAKLFNPENAEDEESWLNKSPDTELIPNYRLGAIFPFAMSKLGLAIICRLYQLQFDAEKMSQNVHLVTCCPGLVKTDQNPLGVRTPEQGADTIVWTATQPKDTPLRGVVCADRKMMDPFILPEGSTIF